MCNARSHTPQRIRLTTRRKFSFVSVLLLGGRAQTEEPEKYSLIENKLYEKEKNIT